MTDAKRLAEMMEPGKLRELADTLDLDISDGYGMSASDVDALCCAAAVLREVAGRGEKPAVCGVNGCESEAQTAPLCGKHVKDFMPNITTRDDGAPVIFAETDKVIEVDPDMFYCCHFNSEDSECHIDEASRQCEAVVAAKDCSVMNGRVIIQAKAKP